MADAINTPGASFDGIVFGGDNIIQVPRPRGTNKPLVITLVDGGTITVIARDGAMGIDWRGPDGEPRTVSPLVASILCGKTGVTFQQPSQ